MLLLVLFCLVVVSNRKISHRLNKTMDVTCVEDWRPTCAVVCEGLLYEMEGAELAGGFDLGLGLGLGRDPSLGVRLSLSLSGGWEDGSCGVVGSLIFLVTGTRGGRLFC